MRETEIEKLIRDEFTNVIMSDSDIKNDFISKLYKDLRVSSVTMPFVFFWSKLTPDEQKIFQNAAYWTVHTKWAGNNKLIHNYLLIFL